MQSDGYTLFSIKPNTLALPQRAHGTGGCGQDEQIKRLPDPRLGTRCDASRKANGVALLKGASVTSSVTPVRHWIEVLDEALQK